MKEHWELDLWKAFFWQALYHFRSFPSLSHMACNGRRRFLASLSDMYITHFPACLPAKFICLD